MTSETSTHDDAIDADEDEDDGAPPSRHRTDGRLRAAMLVDGDPRFPWWLPLPGLAVAGTWAAYMSATDAAPLLDTLLWPGAPIFLATTVTTYFGWRLDLD